MANRQQRLQQAVNKLSKYYGVYTAEDLIARISLESLTGEQTISSSNNNLPIDTTTAEVFNAFLNNSDGCYDINTLCDKIATKLTATSGTQVVNLQPQKEKIGKIFQVVGPGGSKKIKDYNIALYGRDPNSHPETAKTDIKELLQSISTAGGVINSRPNSPTKDAPNLSIILSNTKLIDIKNRYTNAIVLLLNGIPTIELARAVPYLDVKFIFNRPQVNPFNNRLQAPGLVKYLNGAQLINADASNNNALLGLTLGNQVEQKILSGSNTITENHAVAGMEIFTHPQTLTNADETSNRELRTNPVLDKFRPFMSIKDFEANIVASTGMESYKSAKLNLILHDRSRMADIADLIKPDLYGRTELLIEYGWIHPEGQETSNEIRNYYGDLINGMRLVEKYGIQNSSYTFGDDGVVSITLTLFMKGNSDLSTELVSSDDQSVGNSIRELERLQSVIADLRTRVLGTNQNFGSAGAREIRGVQILDMAQDNFSSLLTNSSTRQEISQLERAIAGPNRGTPESRQLIESLKSLFGQTNAGGNNQNRRRKAASAQGNADGAAERLRATIVNSIREKIDKLASGPDPFISGEYLNSNPVQKRNVTGGTRQQQNNFSRVTSGVANPGLAGKTVSLAKLLLLFLAQPLSATNKYDDVQLIFYPFNDYAGFASRINVGQFEIDLTFLAEEWVRYKINNVSRSSTMNIKEFIRFIASTMIDDMAAKSYGLYDNGDSLFKQVFDDNDNTRTLQAKDEAPILQQKIERILNNVTPDGSFRMPQIEIYTECLPAKTQNDIPVEDKSILRIHVYDRLATPHESLGAILRAARNNELGLVGTFPQLGPQTTTSNNPSSGRGANRRSAQPASGNPGIQESNSEIATRYINAALAAKIIKPVEQAERFDNTNNRVYELAGGPEQIKNFLYETMPYIIYGAAGSGIKAANLSSMQDPALTTVNLVRSPRSTDILPNGEQPGGLPMRIIPSELTMQTIGCPFVSFAQHFFIDFQTGTTADNIYAATTITHKISEGDFTTDIKFTPADAYGQYESFISRLKTSIDNLSRAVEQQNNPGTPANTG